MLARTPTVAIARAAPPRARARASTPTPALPGAAAGLVLGGLLLALAFDDGGYFPTAVTAAAVIASAALVLLLALPATRIGPTASAATAAFVALAALAAWTGASARWSPTPDAALVDLRRGVLYAALFGLGLVATAGARPARRAVALVLGVIVIVAGAGVLSRLQPELLGMTRGASAVFDVRLSYPLGYWNAFGALSAIGAVLALGIAADTRARPGVRVGAAAAGPLLIAAIYLSLSRGAWPSLAAGVLALFVLSPWRLSVSLSALVAAVAGALAILALRSQPELLDGTRRTGPGADLFTLQLTALMCAAAVAQALLTVPDLRRRAARRTVAAVVALLAVGLGVALGPAGGASWVAQRYEEFRAPAPALAATGPERLQSTAGARREVYAVALDGFRAQPLRGEGAGSFEERWRRTGSGGLFMRDAHSLVLGTMTELGAIGLLLIAVFLGCVVRAARRCRRGGGALTRSAAAAAGAAVVTWFVHACVDWDWEMPALTGCALALCAALFARTADPLQKVSVRASAAAET